MPNPQELNTVESLAELTVLRNGMLTTIANAIESVVAERDRLRKDLQTIAVACDVGHHDPAEAIRRIVAEVQRLRGLETQRLREIADERARGGVR